MADNRTSNLAKVLVRYCTNIQPKDLVAIYGRPAAEPLILEVYREVIRAGGFPYAFIALDGLERIFYHEANEDQLTHVSRISEMVNGEFDGLIGIQAESNTRNLSNVDPKSQSTRAKAHSGVSESFFKRGASGELKWCGTLYPTDAYAQDAEMSLEEFEDYVYSTTYADTDDPVGEWMAIRKEQQRLVNWMVGKRELVAKGPNIDMRLSIEGRSFENADGRKNMPSGEIFTGPVEDSVNGWVRFTYPAVAYGREMDGVELHFENGKVVKATAEKNEEFLHSQLDTDEGARYLGEWAIGTNKKINRFIKNILFDEKIGGTVHMAVGSGYPETGSENKSAIHMDMICDMRDGGQIFVDDELIYESGEFTI
jgi:aminopeptidase